MFFASEDGRQDSCGEDARMQLLLCHYVVPASVDDQLQGHTGRYTH